MRITEIKEGKKNKNRINIYADGEFVCALFYETAVKNNIRVGQEVSYEVLSEILREDEYKYAFDKALGFLSYRMRSEREIRDKLKKDSVSDMTADRAVEKLKELGYIDDEAFAKIYFDELKESFGKNVIEQKLFMKGIDRDTVRAVTSELEQSELAIEWAEKLKNKYKNDDPQKARSKVFRSMMTRGFAWEDIKKAVSAVYEAEAEDYE